MWGRLTESESKEVARALWDSQYIGDDCLPGQTELDDGVFLVLPQPESGLAEQCFRRKWLDVNHTPHDDEESLSEALWQIGSAIFWLRRQENSLCLTEEEKIYLTELVGRWADTPVQPPHIPLSPFENQFQRSTRRSIVGLHAVISEISLSSSTANKLYEKVRVLNESKTPGFTLMADIVRALPDRLDEIVLSMKTGLVSDRVTMAEDAMLGLFDWMKTSNSSEISIPEPPTDLVREIGVIIAARRSNSLNIALRIAKWIFDEGNEDQKGIVDEMALQGLGYLSEELKYDRRHEQEEHNIPSLRRRCVQLAVSMARQGFEEAPAISRWLEDAESDPMPEVKYAKRR